MPSPAIRKSGRCIRFVSGISARSFGNSSTMRSLIDMTMGLRVKPEVEREGLDVAEHGERAYNM